MSRPSQAAGPAEAQRQGAELDDAPLKWSELQERCLHNLQFARRLLDKFSHRFGEDLQRLQQAQEAGDAERMAQVAHRMKGAAANVAAPSLHAITARLEQSGRSQRTAEAAEWMERLRSEWDRFVEFREAMARRPDSADAARPDRP